MYIIYLKSVFLINTKILITNLFIFLNSAYILGMYLKFVLVCECMKISFEATTSRKWPHTNAPAKKACENAPIFPRKSPPRRFGELNIELTCYMANVQIHDLEDKRSAGSRRRNESRNPQRQEHLQGGPLQRHSTLLEFWETYQGKLQSVRRSQTGPWC